MDFASKEVGVEVDGQKISDEVSSEQISPPADANSISMVTLGFSQLKSNGFDEAEVALL